MQAKPVTSSSIAQPNHVVFPSNVIEEAASGLRNIVNDDGEEPPKRSCHVTRACTKKTRRKRRPLTKAQRIAAYRRADERAMLQPGMPNTMSFMVEAFDMQTGISTMSAMVPNARWFFNPKLWATAAAIYRHVSCKQWLAVKWGRYATIRIIDADAHDGDWQRALDRLWESIRALHLGRGVVIPQLLNGMIQEGTIIDGVIMTSPNGYHYAELFKRDPSVKPGTDKALVRECLETYGVTIRDGELEVFPTSNGQSRLPLGKDCKFVYPPHQAENLTEKVHVLNRLRRVPQRFYDVDLQKQLRGEMQTYCHNTTNIDELVAEHDVMHEELANDTHTHFQDEDSLANYMVQWMASIEQKRNDQAILWAEYSTQPLRKKHAPRKSAPYAKMHVDARRALRKRGTAYRTFMKACLAPKHGTIRVAAKNPPPSFHTCTTSLSSEKLKSFLTTSSNRWVEQVKHKLREGAATGDRNCATWEVAFLLRLTLGWSRDNVESALHKWIDELAHNSRDLNRVVGVRVEHKRVKKLLDRLDVGLHNGRFYQAGNSGPKNKGQAFLVHATKEETLLLWEARGEVFLGDLLKGMPTWVRNNLPTLVGACFAQARGGRLSLSVNTLETFCATPGMKEHPITGEMQPAYMIMISLLQKFGVLGGIEVPADDKNKIAAVYEVNSDVPEEEPKQEEPIMNSHQVQAMARRVANTMHDDYGDNTFGLPEFHAFGYGAGDDGFS